MVENPRVLDPAGLERLVLSRGLLTCCKGDILSCRLDSPTQQVGVHTQGFGAPRPALL